MDLQLTAALILVFLSCCYLVWRGWRLWRVQKKNCGGGCGCSAGAAAEPEKAKYVAISLEKLSRSRGIEKKE
jgi:hypothetical protein